MKKIVILKTKNYKGHWHVAWKSKDTSQVHRLKIYDDKIALLVGKGRFYAFAVSDSGRLLPLKIEGYGMIGDRKYNKLRLL